MIKVLDPDMPELDVFGRLSDVQLLRYYEPEQGVFLAESEKVTSRAVAAGYEPLSFLVEERRAKNLAAFCESFHVPVYITDIETMSKLTNSHITNGMLCCMRRKPMPDLREFLQGASRIAVLENVENPTNVGSIFRSAAALGIDAVILTEDCGDPLYRRTARVSMGTVFQVPWIKLDRKKYPWSQAQKDLKTLGFQFVAMALRDDTVSLENFHPSAENKLAILLGNEGDGLTKETMDNCDVVVKIPMANGVDSLNVSAASAVVFWALRK